MASNEELRRVYDLFTDCWRYFKKYSKKYADVKNTDEYWQAVVNESGEIARRYDNHKFAIALLLAVLDELERKSKELMSDETE